MLTELEERRIKRRWGGGNLNLMDIKREEGKIIILLGEAGNRRPVENMDALSAREGSRLLRQGRRNLPARELDFNRKGGVDVLRGRGLTGGKTRLRR